MIRIFLSYTISITVHKVDTHLLNPLWDKWHNVYLLSMLALLPYYDCKYYFSLSQVVPQV